MKRGLDREAELPSVRAEARSLKFTLVLAPMSQLPFATKARPKTSDLGTPDPRISIF